MSKGNLNAIDYIKLYKEEKKNAKRKLIRKSEDSKTTSNSNDPNAPSTIDATYYELPPTEQSSSTSNTTCYPISIPITNYISESIRSKSTNDWNSHEFMEKYRVGDINHVYYIDKLLSTEFTSYLSTWIKTIPQIPLDILQTRHEDESFYNCKWTHLRHAQRNVALFDLRANSSDDNETTSSDNTQNETLSKPLKILCNFLVQELKVFPESHPPNHVLINEYQANEGIMPHTDGPMYFDTTATFSIGGGDVLFKFSERRKNVNEQTNYNHTSTTSDQISMEIKLDGNGSLVVFKGDAYSNYLHSIDDRIAPSCLTSSTICATDTFAEKASNKCINASEGEIIQRNYRISFTFRHKY